RLGPDIDPLNPPRPAVAPVAPLERDLRLAQNHLAVHREVVWPFVRVGNRCSHAIAYHGRIKLLTFAFSREQNVEIDNDGEISQAAPTDRDRHGCLDLSRLVSWHRTSTRGKHMDLSRFIRDIPDFPRPGIVFKDITPLLADPPAFQEAIRRLEEH